MKVTTSHSMIKPMVKDTNFFLCFTFIMECAVIPILNITLSKILLLYDFVVIY